MNRLVMGVLGGLVLAAVPCRADDIEPDSLRRGLVATYRDNAKPQPAEVSQIDATIALALQPTEAAHPRLGAGGGTVVWRGYLNVLRGGAYRFTVRLRGDFKLKIGGKEVFAASVHDAEPALKSSGDVQLEAGVQPLSGPVYPPPRRSARGTLVAKQMVCAGAVAQCLPRPFACPGRCRVPDRPPARTGPRPGGRRQLREVPSACWRRRHGQDTYQPSGTGFVAGWQARPCRLDRAPGWKIRRRCGRRRSCRRCSATMRPARRSRHAVALYLASLGGPVVDRDRGRQDRGSIGRGSACLSPPAASPATVPTRPTRPSPLRKRTRPMKSTQKLAFILYPISVARLRWSS